MPGECCVPLCKGTGGHKFPWSNRDSMLAWVTAIRNGKWDEPKRIVAYHFDNMDKESKEVTGPSKHSLVCYEHFDEDDYPLWNYCGTKPLIRRLGKDAVPHIFPWSVRESSSAKHRKLRGKKREREESERDIAYREVGAYETVDKKDLCQIQSPHFASAEARSDEQAPSCIDASTQTPRPIFSVREFVSDPVALHHYSGMETFDKFELLLHCLGPAAYDLSYLNGTPTLPVEEQLFITLIKLRNSLDNFEIARKFLLQPCNVTNIFVTWINFMKLQFEDMDFWPGRDTVRYYAPADFKHKFPTTRAIMDGTECPMQKPKQPVAQQATFSTYKHRNTAKVVVGITPGGLMSFCSTAYGGAASDRQIMERSNLARKCDLGDSIMADKGFNVQDLFEHHGVNINIPSFFKKKNRLSGKVVKADRQIASKRVHVERVIGLAKTFKILKKPLNNTESALATEIIKVCFYLCNFKQCIVPKSA